MRFELLAALGGALLPLAFAPFGYAFVAVLALALLFRAWREANPTEAFRRGYWFGLAQYGFGVSWVYISLHEYGGASVWTGVILTGLLVAFLALFPALVGWLATRCFPARGPTVRCLLLFPAAWVFLEWVRGWFLTGFPWLLVGYTQTDTLLRGVAPILGVFGVSWITALLAGLLLQVLRIERRLHRSALCGLAALLGLCLALADWRWTQPAGEPFRAAVLQGNIPQDRKWLPESQLATIRLYAELTRANWGARLIVWPETAIPAYYHQVRESVIAPLERAAQAHHADLLIGVPYYELATDRYYNGLVAVGEQRGYYFKRHLVPFGEYLPLRPVLGFMLDLLEIPLSDFASGDGQQTPLRAAGYPLAATICYEDIFGQEALAGLPAAAYLVNVTNDAWFGDSIAPHQHWQMARMRTMETGRYMVRATNTGVSGIIAFDGTVVRTAPLFQTAAVQGTVTPMGGSTPYIRFGDWPIVTAALAVLLGLAVRRRG